MEQPATTIPELDASQALAAIGTLPEGTPGLIGPPPTVAGAVTAPGSTAAVDRKGASWDPAIHENPARLNAEGRWAKLRGNAARKAKGLPPSGAKLRPAGDKPASEPPMAERMRPEDIPGQQSFLNLGAAPPPAGAGPVVDAEVLPPAAHTPEEYAGMASGITMSLFGLARILMGKAWTPEPEETKAWNEAWKRTLAHYQAPMMGPVVELIPLAMGTVGKRADDPETREKAGRFMGWVRRLFGKKQMAEQRPQQQSGPADAPAPARGGPRIQY